MSEGNSSLPPRPNVGAQFGRLRRLMRKELAEILRDRRTIITLVLMPLLLYPLLTIAFQQFLLAQRVGKEDLVYRFGFRTENDGVLMTDLLKRGDELLNKEGAWLAPVNPEKPDAHEAPPHQQPRPNVEVVFSKNLDQELMVGELDLLIFRRGSWNPNQPLNVDWAIRYREESARGLEALRYLERILAAANVQLLAERAGVSVERPDPVRSFPEAMKETGPKKPTTLAALVPLILILMTITGAVYPAIDLTAGERERGTLEVLVAAPIPRRSVLFAKYIAVLTVAMLTALVNIGAMTGTMWITGIGKTLFGNLGLSPLVFIEILALLLLFAAFFSAVLLALTSFARSFKEAQAYLIPLMLLSLAPGIIGLIPGLQLESFLAIAPLINVVLLSRDLIAGNASLAMAAVVVVTTLLYAGAALALAARVFGAEAVLYSHSSGWGDFFRRPSQPRDFPEPSSALLCLALMFPAYFVLTYAQVYLQDRPFWVSVLVGLTANAFLFLAFPLTSLYMNRARLRPALGLFQPTPIACLAAIVLGLCLWPITHEVTLLLRWLGLATLKAEHLEKIAEGLAKWREISPIFILVVLAGVTPLVEEVFFRGYLFGSLARGFGPRSAIFTSALLFGLFHIFLSFGMAVERFVPTTLMGIILAWVRWRSGSIWPGVLLHAAHNGLIALLGYYEPQLQAAGWIKEGVEELPWMLVILSMAGSAAGAAAMWKATRPRDA